MWPGICIILKYLLHQWTLDSIMSSITVWICVGIDWKCTNIRKHQQYWVIYASTYYSFALRFEYAKLKVLKLKLREKNGPSSSLKVLLSPTSCIIVVEIKMQKFNSSTQICVWVLFSCALTGCVLKRLMWLALTLWRHFPINSVLRCHPWKCEWH